jgi:colicin import membrane protein
MESYKTPECQRKANKKYYEKIKNDPEKVAERKRKQNEAYQKNREKKLQYAKDYQKRNKEKILEKRRKAREELEKLKHEELKKKIIQEYLENP